MPKKKAVEPEVQTTSGQETAPVETEAAAAVQDTDNTEAGAKSDRFHWYVVHTYSGYEDKVKRNIENTIVNRHLEDRIIEVRVPVQDMVEYKDGSKKTVRRKLFPGYVLINMDMDDETWYVVRNTRGVTGFVGPGSKPVQLPDTEIKPLGIKTENNMTVDFGVGDTIAVVSGVWRDTIGAVQRMDFSKQTATIHVELFGRETPVEISFAEVRKVDR